MNKIPREKTRSLPDALLMAALVVAAFLLFFRFSSVPGLHGDEAWVGIRAHGILTGDRPILGMNDYTGALYQYLAAGLLHIFGFKTWVVRAFGATASLVSVYLYFACVRELFGRVLAGWAALILVLMPFFSAFGRVANEVFALNPVLGLGSLFLILSAKRRSPRIRCFSYLGAGILIGWGIWSHVIFVAFAVALGCAALFQAGSALFRRSPLYWTTLGAIGGLFPRILYQLRSLESLKRGLFGSWSFRDLAHSYFERFRAWPREFLQIAHGDEIFKRFTGAILFQTPDFTALLFLAGLALTLTAAATRRAPKGDLPAEALLLVFAVILFLATEAISPGMSERYFLLPLYCVPVLIAMLSRIRRPRWALLLLAAAFTLVQLARIGVDYFHSFAESGGRISTFYIGGYAENSNNYMNMRYVYEKLVSLKATQVCGEFLVWGPLEFYQLSERRFDDSWDPKDCLDSAAHGRAGVYAVVYSSGMRNLSPAQLPGFTPVFGDSRFQILEASSKGH